MLLEFWDSTDSHYKELDTDEVLIDNKTLEQIKKEIYNQALEDVRDLMTYHQTGLTGYLTIMPDELDKLYKCVV